MASRSWNRVELIGNLPRDPEMRYTPTGSAVVTFSIATNRTFTSSDGEKREEADFHRCVAWNKLAELCVQLLKKGSRVFVSGRLQNRSWEGQDGQQRNTTEIVIEDMILLTSRGVGEGYEEYSSSSTPLAVVEETPSRQVEEEPKERDKKQETRDKVDSEETIRPSDETSDAGKEEEKEDSKEKKSVPKADEDPGDLDDLPF